MLRPIIALFSTSVLLVTSASTGNAQQSASGNCNAQLQGNSNDVNITCVLASSSIGIPGNPPRSSTVEVNLQASVRNLQRGSNQVTLWLRNNTPNQTVTVPTYGISISDELGNVYEPDALAMYETGLSHTVPPNSAISVNYVLRNSISQNASNVTFTLDGLWTKQTGDRFRIPIPFVQWRTSLNGVTSTRKSIVGWTRC